MLPKVQCGISLGLTSLCLQSVLFLIDGKLGTNVYVNNANINVVVTLFDPTGVGLALGDEVRLL